MRRAAFVLSSAVVASGCSFVYDFSGFHPADAAAPVDAADLGEDAGPPDANVDLGFDAEVDAQVPLTPETFYAQLRELACAKALRCTNKLILADIVQMLCHEDIGPVMLATQFIGTTGTAAFDTAAAERCLSSLAVMDCSLSNQFLSECEDALRGDGAVGTSCVTNFDCLSDACVDQEAACGRVCEERGSMGFICTENAQCMPLLRCREGVCNTPGFISEMCDETSDCRPGFWCPTSTDACVIAPDLDERCEIDLSGDPCVGSLVCIGGTCLVGGDLDALCDVGRPCRPGFTCSSSSGAGTCVQLSGPGGFCDSSQNCPFLFECLANACVSYPALGESCVARCVQGVCGVASTCVLQPAMSGCSGVNGLVGAECAGYCPDASRMCVDLLGPGALCTDDAECIAGTECLGAMGSATCQSCTPP